MKTIINLFEESVNRFPDNVYLWQKVNGKFAGSTYSQVRTLVHEFGAGLMQLGLKKGDRVTLLAEGRNEWVISELGILYNGAINVPLSVKLNEPEEIAFRLKHSGSRMAITSGRQIKKILEVWPSLKELELVICFDKIETDQKNVLFYSDIIASGRKYLMTERNGFWSYPGALLMTITQTSVTHPELRLTQKESYSRIGIILPISNIPAASIPFPRIM